MYFSFHLAKLKHFKLPKTRLEALFKLHPIKYNCTKKFTKFFFYLYLLKLLTPKNCFDDSQNLLETLDKVSYHPKLFLLLTNFVGDKT